MNSAAQSHDNDPQGPPETSRNENPDAASAESNDVVLAEIMIPNHDGNALIPLNEEETNVNMADADDEYDPTNTKYIAVDPKTLAPTITTNSMGGSQPLPPFKESRAFPPSQESEDSDDMEAALDKVRSHSQPSPT